MKGYIAIISALVISFVLMVVTFGVSISGYFVRFNILDSYSKEVSNSLAETCVDTALLRLAENSLYSGNETVALGTDQCSILPLETSGTQKIIKARAVVNDAYTNLKVTVLSSDLSIVSWEEVPSL